MRVENRSRRIDDEIVKLGEDEYKMRTEFKLKLENVGAETLASDASGRPAFTKFTLGAGTVFFSAFPIELDAACKTGVVSGEFAVPYYKFYEKLGFKNPDKIAKSHSPYIGITEHKLGEKRLILALNHTPHPMSTEITLSRGKFERFIDVAGGTCTPIADGFEITLPANTGLVAVVGL